MIKSSYKEQEGRCNISSYILTVGCDRTKLVTGTSQDFKSSKSPQHTKESTTIHKTDYYTSLLVLASILKSRVTCESSSEPVN